MKHRIWTVSVFILLVFCFNGKTAQCREVEMVWLETDMSKATIYFASHQGNSWSAKQGVAENHHLMVTPVVASLGGGEQLVVWVNVLDQAKLSFGYPFGKNGHWLK